MNKSIFPLLAVVTFLLLHQPLTANWLNFLDETTSRLELNSISSNDGEEKDISVADLNKDGWTDVIVVRRNPFSVQGAGTDVLLLNDHGVLKDSTSIYAPGFISTPSDSRDVIIADFDGDGWEDVVMVNTFGQQPIYYCNLGNDVHGKWLGLADSSATRFPVLAVSPLQFCAGWAGDLTGDNALDIYLSNYKNSGGSEDVLLINDGNGVFTDQSAARLGSLRRSAFGTSCEIHDMDNDGDNDIVKISTLYSTLPWFDNGVYVLFNDGTGNFNSWQMMTSSAPYMFAVGDLNDDNRLDMYVVDDNQDYVNLATGFNPDVNIAHTNTILASSPRTTQFGGNVKMADLDNDGDLDVGVASADLDIPPCESGGLRKFALLRNDGVSSGVISDPNGTNINGWNESNYDFAFLDVNNDGKVDIFNARCSTYEVWIQEYLLAPVNLSASAGLDRITLNWNPNSEGFLAYYTLYRANVNNPDSANVLGQVATPITSYQDSSVSFGQTYYYWLTATDTFGFETDLSDVAFSLFDGQCVYSEPNSLAVTNVAATSVTLNWTADDDAVSYELRGRTINSATWITLQVNSTNGIFDVVDLYPNNTFVWQLKKVCQLAPLKESAWTSLDTFTTLPLPICNNPNPVSTTNITATSAHLNWTPVVDAAGYQLFGQALGSSSVVTINISPLITSFFATGLAPGASYVWAVRTLCTINTQTPYSEFSTIKSFTTLPAASKTQADHLMESAKLNADIYPNPSDGNFILDFDADSRRDVSIQINSVSGRVVYSSQTSIEPANSIHEIQLGEVTNGIYFLTINSNEFVLNRKLIINR